MTKELEALLDLLIEHRSESLEIQTTPGKLRLALGEEADNWDIRSMIFRLDELGKIQQKYAEGGDDNANLLLVVYG